MLKDYSEYATEKAFLYAVDNQIDIVLEQLNYDATEQYLQDIQNIYRKLRNYIKSLGENLSPAVTNKEDPTGNKRINMILTEIENRLQLELYSHI